MSADLKNFELELTSGNVKAAMKDAGAPSADLWKVPREHIRVIPGLNPRSMTRPESIAHVRWIADSIKENGFNNAHPLTGFVSHEDGVNYINVTDGHHRLAAVDLAISEGTQIYSIPVVVAERGTTMEDITVRLVTSNSGMPLTPYEIGIVCKRLIGMGLDETTIAKRLGFKSGKRYVEDLLTLVGAPRDVRDMVNEGQVSATLAVETVKKLGNKAPEQLSTALKKAQDEGKTRITKKDLPKQATREDATPAAMPPRTPSKAVAPDPDNGVSDVLRAGGDQDEALYAAYREWLKLGVKERQTFRDCFPKIVRHFDAAQEAGDRA